MPIAANSARLAALLNSEVNTVMPRTPSLTSPPHSQCGLLNQLLASDLNDLPCGLSQDRPALKPPLLDLGCNDMLTSSPPPPASQDR
jgi:hypothetical protein